MTTTAGPKTGHVLRIMAANLQVAQEIHPPAEHGGDVKLHWDPEDPESLANAREAFRRARAKGFRAYRTPPGGRGTGEVITEFDPAAGEIWMRAPVVGG